MLRAGASWDKNTKGDDQVVAGFQFMERPSYLRAFHCVDIILAAAVVDASLRVYNGEDKWIVPIRLVSIPHSENNDPVFGF